ncbi:DUF5994 family protein [Streptomyces chartreusis]|uniref:DUF5994 family protein n=1 Tax=Streptomyces chartreusis TaxID=1969 RepID=UPI00380DFA3B
MNAPTGGPASADPSRTAPPTPARLALRPPNFPPGPVCGAWWPRSDDLMTELPALTDAFDARCGRVTSAGTPRETWPEAPCDLPVTGHTVTAAAWFVSGVEPHTVRLYSYGVGCWDLLVIPPETDSAEAGRLMAAVSDPALHLTASDLMAAEGSPPTGD